MSASGAEIYVVSIFIEVLPEALKTFIFENVDFFFFFELRRDALRTVSSVTVLQT